MKQKSNSIFLVFALLAIFVMAFNTSASISKNSVLTAADEMAYQGFRSQGLTIGGNYDAVWDTSITVTAGSAWTYPSQSPDVTTRKEISFSLKSNTFLRAVTMYANEDFWFKLRGDGINAKYAGVDSTKIGVLRAGNSITFECPNLTSVIAYGNGSTAAQVDIFLMAARSAETTPLR